MDNLEKVNINGIDYNLGGDITLDQLPDSGVTPGTYWGGDYK